MSFYFFSGIIGVISILYLFFWNIRHDIILNNFDIEKNENITNQT